jgi:steroid delta-isomerase-like uncharacterized protein
MSNRTVLLAAVLASALYGCGDFTSVAITSVERTLELQHSEVWSKGNFDSISSIYTEDYVGHFPGGQTVNGRDGLKKTVQSHRVSFPNWDEQVLEIIVDGNHAATRFRSRGTHDGEFLGIPATGNKIDILEASIYHMVDGKIAEQWAFPDVASLQQQLVPQQSD